MDGGSTLKAKVVSSKVLSLSSPRPASRINNVGNLPSRPASPTKPLATSNSNVDSPSFRPKAKVNNSATTRRAVVKSSTSNGTTPRSRSPVKTTPRIRTAVTSPPPTSKSFLDDNPRSPTAASAPVTPQRTSSLTTASVATSSSMTLSDDSNTGGTLHHAMSFSSLQPNASYLSSHKRGTVSTTSSPRFLNLMPVDREMSNSPTPRIRSKVSAVAKITDSSTTPGISPTAHPSTRSLHFRTRTPSVSSNISRQFSQSSLPSPPSQIYPITSASSVANPHRYAPPRPPSRTIIPAVSQIFPYVPPKAIPLAGEGSPPLSRGHFGVDIPPKPNIGANSASLPPLSPPMSAVSFSSHSSISRSSANVSGSQSTSTASSRFSPSATRNGETDLNTTLVNLMEYTSGLPSAMESEGDVDGEMEDDEHQVRAAAKSNRKIADLEITNRSLLAINATLEATKHRQAREIRELKRKLRESRLILPPPAYRVVKSSLEPSELADEEEDEEDDDEDENNDEKDEIYHRIRVLIDNLLTKGKQALEKQVIDFPESGKGGAKVLTAEEVRDWHQSNDNDHDNHEMVPVSQDDDVFMDARDASLTTSEAEVEALTLIPTVSHSPPPIFVTKPSQSVAQYTDL